KLEAQAIEQAHRTGARGLKILKTLGLYLRENITSGTLVKIDDPRFDPMWDTCGELHIPVAIHVSDPVAFFTPTDRFNERYEELNNHPDWSFYGGDFPSNAELLEARNRVIAGHPKTQFVVFHVGNFYENLESTSITHRRKYRLRAAGAYMGSICRNRFCARCTTRMLPGTFGLLPDANPPPACGFAGRLRTGSLGGGTSLARYTYAARLRRRIA